MADEDGFRRCDEETPECPHGRPFNVYTNDCSMGYGYQFIDEMKEGMMMVYGILFPILAILVLATNSIVILALRAQKMHRASVEPLFWMAVAALLMALSPLPFTIYFYNLNYRAFSQSEFLCTLHKLSMEILPFFFNTIITFLTLLLGVQRFIAVQFPLRSYHWCSRKMSLTAIKSSCLVAFVISVIFYASDTRILIQLCFSLSEGSRESILFDMCYIDHSPMELWMGEMNVVKFHSFMRIFLNIIPSCTLFVLTVLLVRTLNDSHVLLSAHRHHGRKGGRSTSKTTIMLTVIIVLFLVARFPSTVLLLMNQASLQLGTPESSILNVATNPYLLALSNITFMTVHPLTFAVYLLMSRRFRVSLRRILGWRRLASDSACAAYSSPRSTFLATNSLKGSDRHSRTASPSPTTRFHRPVSVSTSSPSGEAIVATSIIKSGGSMRCNKKEVVFHPMVACKSISGTERRELTRLSPKERRSGWEAFLGFFRRRRTGDGQTPE